MSGMTLSSFDMYMMFLLSCLLFNKLDPHPGSLGRSLSPPPVPRVKDVLGMGLGMLFQGLLG